MTRPLTIGPRARSRFPHGTDLIKSVAQVCSNRREMAIALRGPVHDHWLYSEKSLHLC